MVGQSPSSSPRLVVVVGIACPRTDPFALDFNVGDIAKGGGIFEGAEESRAIVAWSIGRPSYKYLHRDFSSNYQY